VKFCVSSARLVPDPSTQVNESPLTLLLVYPYNRTQNRGRLRAAPRETFAELEPLAAGPEMCKAEVRKASAALSRGISPRGPSHGARDVAGEKYVITYRLLLYRLGLTPRSWRTGDYLPVTAMVSRAENVVAFARAVRRRLPHRGGRGRLFASLDNHQSRWPCGKSPAWGDTWLDVGFPSARRHGGQRADPHTPPPSTTGASP